MIKTRLVKLLSHTKKYIVQMVLWQWIALLGQIAAIFSIGRMVDCILMHQMSDQVILTTFMVLVVAVAIRFLCDQMATRASFAASVDVKRILREKIYEKLLCLGASYREHVSTSEVVQMSTEGVEQLEIYFAENPIDGEKFVNQVLVNKRSRESAEKQRLNIKKKLSGNIDISNRVQKFVDCRSKDVEKREIYIVEGDSALGSVKLSRDAEYQGIMPVRGKILNCLKADYARIFKSEIITDLIRVLGCGVEIQNKHVKDLAAFDLNNLRWSKVVICTDGDVDGFQIRTLILTMLYRLTPTLIQQGYVYIAETPLFEINCGDKTWFAYSDKEKADIVKALEGKKYKIDRSKGLGENDPDMMSLTTMNPDTRRLIKVNPTDLEATREMFDVLLGNDLEGRKRFIKENGSRYLAAADIS